MVNKKKKTNSLNKEIGKLKTMISNLENKINRAHIMIPGFVLPAGRLSLSSMPQDSDVGLDDCKECGSNELRLVYVNTTTDPKDIKVWVRNKGNCKIQIVYSNGTQVPRTREWEGSGKDTFDQEITVASGVEIYLKCGNQIDTGKKDIHCSFEWKIK